MLFKKSKMLLAGLALMVASCQSGPQQKTEPAASSNFHKIVVQEVLQATEYTYLHAKDNSGDTWLAVPSMQAKAGDTYYYEGGIEMKKFESKDLKRVFESVILLEKLNSAPNSASVVPSDKPYATAATEPANTGATAAPQTEGAPATGETYTRKAVAPEKKEVKIAAPKGGITIAELYNKKESYAGKSVIIKGQVTKFTPAVMGKNWIHIQDGTDAGGKFDLTVTSTSEVKIGDVVTLAGKIGLNKDLGYGYFFDVIMEDAVAKQ